MTDRISRFHEIEVWSNYEGTWVAGFELAESEPATDGSGYLVRRQSDRVILPERFDAERIRRCDARSQHPSSG